MMSLANLYTPKQSSAASSTDYVFSQLIPYIGNKRKLLWLIEQAIRETGVSGGTFADFFTGSGVVARFAKLSGFRVLANDWEPYAKVLNQAYIACNTLPVFAHLDGAQSAFETLNSIPPLDGYLATHLCPRFDENPNHDTERLFFTRANGMKLDAMREQIQLWRDQEVITSAEEGLLIAAMLYSVSYVSNTSGVFKGFHRGWGGRTQTALHRIRSDVRLRIPILHDNGLHNAAYRMDAQALATRLAADGETLDIAYLDPPYNQHPYGSNYHVLNTVALWDKPEITPHIEGRNKSAIRLDWRTERRSAYNYATALAAYEKLIQTISARYILTSYSTDGNIPLENLLQAAAGRGKISCVTHAYKRYRVSAQRMSAKPMNVEFVLTIDTSQQSSSGWAEILGSEIRRLEADALATHHSTLS